MKRSLCLPVLVLSASGCVSTGKYNAALQRGDSLSTELDSMKQEATRTKASHQTELQAAQQKLNQAQDELKAKIDELAQVSKSLETVKKEKETVEKSLLDKRTELSKRVDALKGITAQLQRAVEDAGKLFE